MSDLCRLIWCAVIGPFRSQAALQAEIVLLRHQLNVLRRRSPKRVNLSNIDRLVFAGIYGLAPKVLDALQIIKPETVIGWHRAGFRTYWRWKSRPRGGRPRTPDEIRQLIRDMSIANSLWGAPRIHGELLKLGIDVGQTTVAKYMAKHRRPPTQSPWQNGYAERLIGSIRRECLDNVVVFGERHLSHLLRSYQKYYNDARTHLSLDKDAPVSRAIETVGSIIAKPLLGGLHHQYVRN
jgi:hypothetical protein